jgi:hypothetical protein
VQQIVRRYRLGAIPVAVAAALGVSGCGDETKGRRITRVAASLLSAAPGGSDGSRGFECRA